jgi:hypothetical protein
MRELLVRKRAREFAHKVKGSNLAFKLGDSLIDWLKDDELPAFRDRLWELGLVQREDTLWEER